MGANDGVQLVVARRVDWLGELYHDATAWLCRGRRKRFVNDRPIALERLRHAFDLATIVHVEHDRANRQEVVPPAHVVSVSRRRPGPGGILRGPNDGAREKAFKLAPTQAARDTNLR